ncbi:hypothetical protein [Deinococcus sp. PESE-13]
MTGPIQRQETTVLTAPAGLPSRANLITTAVAGGAAIIVLAGAAVALFQLSVTLVTGLAILVAVLGTVIMLPALQMALAASRLRAMEAVARANPIETLILKRQDLGRVAETKARELQQAAGLIGDLEMSLRGAAQSLSPEELAAEMADLQQSKDALAVARERLSDLETDMRDFDKQIERAKLREKLSQAKGNIARALGEAQLTPEQQHVTESALSEIARRAGRNAEALDQALTAAGRRRP